MFQKKPRKPRRGEANIRLLELNRVVRLLKVGGKVVFWGDCVWRFWGIWGLACMDEFGRGAYLGMLGAARGGV